MFAGLTETTVLSICAKRFVGRASTAPSTPDRPLALTCALKPTMIEPGTARGFPAACGRFAAPATAINHQPPRRAATVAEKASSTPSSNAGRNATGLTGGCENHANVPFSANAAPPAALAHRVSKSRRKSRYVHRPARISSSTCS